MAISKNFTIALLFLMLLPWNTSLADAVPSVKETDEEVSAAGVDIAFRRFAAQGSYLMVWLAPEYGFHDSHRMMARAFSEKGIEIWQANIVDALFLPQGTQSMRQLDGTHIADLIEAAHARSGKKIILVGDSYAAPAALIGAHRWQERKLKQDYLLGAILFSPYSLAAIPPLGQAPKFLPVIYATNIPIIIIQAKNSGVYGQFPLLLETLRRHDSPVYVGMVPDIMSLFYIQPPTPAMQKPIKPLASRINGLIKLLSYHKVPPHAPALTEQNAASNGIDIALKAFAGNFAPPPLNLPDIHGQRVERKDYAGKITLVNFWATWCPPCVEEIPMMNRLMRKMQKRPFELISINYAEDKQAIFDFMKKVNIEFPVLLDHNGDFARRWNVISYPSTFVIAPDGRVAFGVNAAIDWDSPDVLEKIQALYK